MKFISKLDIFTSNTTINASLITLTLKKSIVFSPGLAESAGSSKAR